MNRIEFKHALLCVLVSFAIIQSPMMKVVAQDIIDKPIIKVDKNAIGKDDERQYERQYQKAFERAKYLYHRGIYYMIRHYSLLKNLEVIETIKSIGVSWMNGWN